MRTYRIPERVSDQKNAYGEMPAGRWLSVDCPGHDAALRFGSRPWPYFELRLDGRTYVLDGEEVMQWLRYA